MCQNLLEMRLEKMFVLFMVVLSALESTIECNLTPRNIALHNYPLEEHTVQTSDGYLLSTYRIRALTAKRSGVVLLQHGFTLSSDVWLLRGPKEDLPYLLADAGYDVWLGNHRGNEYGLKHSNLDPIADRKHFWNFTWHEMGYYDLPNIIDYILEETGEKSLHYVGYSQGGLVALVLLMTRPEFAEKFKSLQFTAPTVYMRNLNVPVPASWIGKLRNYLSRYLDWWGYGETLQFARWNLHKRMCKAMCADGAWLRPVFKKIFSMIGGPVAANEDYEHILTEICGSVPVGASSKQLLHYMQLYATGGFTQFDYGSADRNLRQYGQVLAPSYNVSSIKNCIAIYYSETDKMCGPEDVRQLGRDLQCAELHRLPYAAWNHGDFVWSRHARYALHEPIIAKMDAWRDGMQIRFR
ncbi:lipase 3-like isoform X1 [Bactrocera tryoni]|uniref:lipase 3-like isoform X1 n=1 Tax=Bactrocera tryoni TaxID=59916 RepID=UPI001A95A600|nr:lipase 3-like isoform X1 [Bactrocera tryoni]